MTNQVCIILPQFSHGISEFTGLVCRAWERGCVQEYGRPQGSCATSSHGLWWLLHSTWMQPLYLTAPVCSRPHTIRAELQTKGWDRWLESQVNVQRPFLFPSRRDCGQSTALLVGTGTAELVKLVAVLRGRLNSSTYLQLPSTLGPCASVLPTSCAFVSCVSTGQIPPS